MLDAQQRECVVDALVEDVVGELPVAVGPSSQRFLGRRLDFLQLIRCCLPAHSLSRRAYFWILPVDVLGSSPNSTIFGALK